MAARLTSEQIQNILKLKAQGKSNYVIADLVGCNRDSVARYIAKGCACKGMQNTHTTKCPKWREVNAAIT